MSNVPTIEALSYSEWFAKNEQWLNEYFAETGMDRELCFDFDVAAERQYDKYIQNHEKGVENVK